MTLPPLLPESINSPTDSRMLVSWCIGTIGPGYHPDTAAGDYVTNNGNFLFEAALIAQLDRLHEEAFRLGHGELMYDHGLELQRAALGLNPVDHAVEGE